MSDAQWSTIVSLQNLLEKMDYEALRDYCVPEYRHYIRPASLGFSHKQPDGITLEDAIAFPKARFAHFKSLHFGAPQDVVRGTDRVAFWYETEGITKDGNTMKQEGMCIYHFVPGTDKLLKGVYMNDSLRAAKVAEAEGKPIPYHE
ncbi:hypothetical protein P7C70_g2668, partial [Phenoliferia sp. Uapishka_3]